ncbi:hypothetical protein TrST_g12210 [Triparma strigata]|uniref:Uncharacterized protein n=1 Tax=Triparma strigata TaxID=1606541 RepID=A0A9W7B724_9STRA|nr:hypothetical protein TrST_g12210 [Triparma strigata]
MDNETLKDALEKAVAEREKVKQESLDMAAKLKSVMDELKSLKDKDSHSTPALVSEPLYDVENIAKTFDLLQSTQLTFKNNVVHNVTFNVVVHDTVEVMKEAIMKEHKQAANKSRSGLHQSIVKDDLHYWRFAVENNKTCDLLMTMTEVTTETTPDVVRIGVSSVDEATTGIVLPAATQDDSNKMFRLILTRGTIILRPLPLGQCSFVFTSEVKVGMVSGESSGEKPPKGDACFKKLATLFYKRFEQKDVIDIRK